MTADTDILLKYVCYHDFLRQCDAGTKAIIETAPIQGDRKYISVDYKVQKLRTGTYTCIPGWHSDTRNDPDALHHLYVIGHNRTEFLVDGEPQMINEAAWHTYGHDLHRGPRVRVDEVRTLIRITESNIVRPKGIY